MSKSGHDPLPARVEQRIDAQLAVAERLRGHLPAAASGTAPYVTISRQYGCEAMELAELLAPRLAQAEALSGDPWQVYSRQLLDSLIAEEHLTKRVTDALDVRSRSGIEEFFQTMIGASPPDIRVLRHLIRIERALATLGRCIIVGRGGVLLTAGLPGGLHIRLVAPEAVRLKSLVARFGWEQDKAQQFLHAEEQGRHSFYRKYLGQDPNNPEHYDLVVNTARLTREEQVDTIVALFAHRLKRAAI